MKSLILIMAGLLLAVTPCLRAQDAGKDAGQHLGKDTGTNSEASSEELAKAAQNPVAKLISVPFQRSGNQWVVPVGGGIGKLQWFGKLPVNFQLEAFGNAVKQDYGPDWQLRFEIKFLFPK